jgi:hypothetical protein
MKSGPFTSLFSPTFSRNFSNGSAVPPANAGLAGAVAALALLITNVGTLREAWCKNIGTFCSPPPESTDWAKSDVVYVSSEGILASTVAGAYSRPVIRVHSLRTLDTNQKGRQARRMRGG